MVNGDFKCREFPAARISNRHHCDVAGWLGGDSSSSSSSSICHSVTDSILPPTVAGRLNLSDSPQHQHGSSHLSRLHLHQLRMVVVGGMYGRRRRTALEGNQRYDVRSRLWSINQASVYKAKFHYTDFPETSPFGEVCVMEFGLKGTSRVCRGRQEEVGIVEFELNRQR